jgi:putative transposon-encoded protein
MLDKFTEKMLESAMSGYRPRLEEMSKIRVEELVAIKAKVRTNPEEVEAWFDKEITKAGNIDVGDILKKMQM